MESLLKPHKSIICQLLLTGLFALALAWPQRATAASLEASVPATSETMHLDASYLDVSGPENARRVEAEGSAIFRSGEVEIRAQRMVMDQGAQRVTAAGNVTSTAGSDFLHADALDYDMQTRRSTLQHASLVAPTSQVYVRSQSLLQQSPRRFSLTDATLSTCTCDLDNPPAYLRARAMDVDLDSYARMRNAVVYLEGVPVFASPFLMIPLGSGRKTGFLFPRFGFSGRDGFRLVPAFIWVTSPRTELLLEGILETRRGLGGNAHFGYSTVATEGYVRGGYMYELFRTRTPGFTLGSWMNPYAAYSAVAPVSLALPPVAQRWNIDTSHTARLGDFARARLQSTLVSDSNYYRDLGTSLEDFSRERSATRAEAYYWQRRLGLSLDTAMMTQTSSRDTTRIQRLPRLTITGFQLHPRAGLAGVWDLQLENDIIDIHPPLFALNPERYTHAALAAQLGTRWLVDSLHRPAGGVSLELGVRSYLHNLKPISARQAYPQIAGTTHNPQASVRPWLHPTADVILERIYAGGTVHWIRPYVEALVSSYHGDSTVAAVWLGEEASSAWLAGGHAGVESGLALDAGTLSARLFVSQVTYTTDHTERLQYMSTRARAN